MAVDDWLFLRAIWVTSEQWRDSDQQLYDGTRAFLVKHDIIDKKSYDMASQRLGLRLGQNSSDLCPASLGLSNTTGLYHRISEPGIEDNDSAMTGPNNVDSTPFRPAQVRCNTPHAPKRPSKQLSSLSQSFENEAWPLYHRFIHCLTKRKNGAIDYDGDRLGVFFHAVDAYVMVSDGSTCFLSNDTLSQLGIS
jgi:hypothetical protein